MDVPIEGVDLFAKISFLVTEPPPGHPGKEDDRVLTVITPPLGLLIGVMRTSELTLRMAVEPPHFDHDSTPTPASRL